MANLRSTIRKFILKGSILEKKWIDSIIPQQLKEKLRQVIIETDSPEGRKFDLILMVIIVMSVIIVMFETIPEIHEHFFLYLFIIEWIITIFFTIEYLIRVYVERNSLRYIFSFFGIVDLLSFLPSYLSLFILGSQHLLIVRILRLMRIFRIFKLGHFVEEGGVVVSALRASRTKIYVFMAFVVLMAVIIGSALYMVEGGTNPEFRSIPHGIYWAIVTLTTVGYGDIAPITALGRFLATLVMITGYGVIAVPTGIVTAEISNRVLHMGRQRIKCKKCGEPNHIRFSKYCHSCGKKLRGDPDS